MQGKIVVVNMAGLLFYVCDKPVQLHRVTFIANGSLLCPTISASKSAQMYRITCSPFQATGVLFRHPKVILTGDGS
ncbi:hypothetical protein [Xenorhabdus griffiniae]|uniref:hypothetical protein n=1 Tax=Xenorhabdus griffiniae TaxID=351672 RepID=UPI001673846F|nr:hypothetical protein [Xenorhabdus griffiniae]